MSSSRPPVRGGGSSRSQATSWVGGGSRRQHGQQQQQQQASRPQAASQQSQGSFRLPGRGGGGGAGGANEELEDDMSGSIMLYQPETDGDSYAEGQSLLPPTGQPHVQQQQPQRHYHQPHRQHSHRHQQQHAQQAYDEQQQEQEELHQSAGAISLDGSSRTSVTGDYSIRDMDPARVLQLLEEVVTNRQHHPQQQQHHQGSKAAAANTGSGLNAQQTVELLRRWLWAHPAVKDRQTLAHLRGKDDATALHFLAQMHNAPVDVVSAILQAAPDAASLMDLRGWLPLHIACGNGSVTTELLQVLIQAYPQGKVQPDLQRNLTPLHFFASMSYNTGGGGSSGGGSNPSSNTTAANLRSSTNSATTAGAAGGTTAAAQTQLSAFSAMAAACAQLLSDTGAAEFTDKLGMVPLHYACAYGTDPAVLAVLVDAYPDSVTAREHKGRTPMHLAMANSYHEGSPAVVQFLLEYSTESKNTIHARDHDGYLPLHLLVQAANNAVAASSANSNNNNGNNNSNNNNNGPSGRHSRSVPYQVQRHVEICLSLYLAAEPVAGADFLRAIQDLPDWLQETAVVSKHVRNVLNDKIVQRFPTSILMLDGYILILIIVSFGLATTGFIPLIPQNDNMTMPDLPPDIQREVYFVLLGATYFLLRELVQIASLISLGSFPSYWKDPINWLDVAVIFMLYYYGFVMLGGAQGEASAFAAGVAVTQALLYVDVIMYLKTTYVDFAVFVGGVVYVVQRLYAFLVSVGIILLAFAQMFFFIHVNTKLCDTKFVNDTLAAGAVKKECDFPFCRFDNSLLKLYTMMMGNTNGEQWYSVGDTNYRIVTQLLFVVYCFFVIILFSKVLIAIVTDSYEVIQNDRSAIVFWSNRLDFVAEMDAIAYGAQRRLGCFGNSGATPNRRGANAMHLQETANGPAITNLDGSSGLAAAAGATSNSDGMTESFRQAWQNIRMLFDLSEYDEIGLLEAWVYNFLRLFCILIVIPLWLVAGLVTAGALWPPQVREALFAQQETATSRSELERRKLEQLRTIQTNIGTLKLEIVREMAMDREEVMRTKEEVETVQSEVLSDLQQVRELLASLLGGR